MLEWKGWIVCSLLISARLALIRYPFLLPDVVYSVAGLATAFIGALTSGEIRSALTNPVSLAMIVFSLILTLFRRPFQAKNKTKSSLISAIPWQRVLLVFSAYLFYFASERSHLSAWLAQWLSAAEICVAWLPYLVLFCAGWGGGIILPIPVVCGILFSSATTWSPGEPHSLSAAALCIGSGSLIPFLKKLEIIKRFRKWKSQVGIRF